MTRAQVNCVAWAPNSIYVASGGLDCSIIIWSLDLPDKHYIMRNAHDQVSRLFGPQPPSVGPDIRQCRISGKENQILPIFNLKVSLY